MPTLSAIVPYLEQSGSSPDPLLKCSTGQPLFPGFLSQWLTDTFVAARADGNIANQSFRTGAAFVDARAGSPYHLFQAIGRDGQEVPTRFKSGFQQKLWQN